MKPKGKITEYTYFEIFLMVCCVVIVLIAILLFSLRQTSNFQTPETKTHTYFELKN